MKYFNEGVLKYFKKNFKHLKVKYFINASVSTTGGSWRQQLKIAGRDKWSRDLYVGRRMSVSVKYSLVTADAAVAVAGPRQVELGLLCHLF